MKLKIIWPSLHNKRTNVNVIVTFTFGCLGLAASNWPAGHPHSDYHVSNPHLPNDYLIQAAREDP